MPEKPLDLEIGAGVGFHALRYALAHPERQILAVEHTRVKFEKFQRRYENHGSPENLFPVHANAISFVAHGLAAQSLERIFILYPNPELKNPAQRWVRMPFMECLLSCLKPGGRICLATNKYDYALEAKEYMQECWGLKLVSEKELTESDAPRTHFEKKYLARSEVCFDFIWQKS